VVRDDAVDTDEDQAALSICPGIRLDAHRPAAGRDRWIPELLDAFGPVLQVFEGHAADDELRHHASSGGASSALALHQIERSGSHGVLHIAARPDAPHLNHTVLSTTRGQILAATGSRYAPASPCDGLALVEQAPAPCAFIGKPCDVAALSNLRRQSPSLDANVGLTIAFFCAGTPSTAGTLAMLRKLGVQQDTVQSVRYRGRGWPGQARVELKEGGKDRQLTYQESWGQLQAYRPWRCYICPDHTGEYADVSVGDPWYREIQPDEPGSSLILVRTERGRDAVQRAIEDGALVARPLSPQLVRASQPNLIRAHASVWARLLTMKLFGAATPRFDGLGTFRLWWKELSPWRKLRSFTGTARQIVRRRLAR